MIGVHEDQVDSRYMRAVYRRGSIVRFGEDWGVVTASGGRYDDRPFISWCIDGKWRPPVWNFGDLSAPYVHTYAGIPDEVLARATYYKLVDTDLQPDTTDNN